MLLTEFEGKTLLTAHGLHCPRHQLIAKLADLNEHLSAGTFADWSLPIFLKAQVLHGNRARQGLVVSVQSLNDLSHQAELLFAQQDQNQQPVTQILIEEGVAFSRQVYVSFSYDTATRGPVLRFSDQAGEGIEQRAESLRSFPFSMGTLPSAIFPDQTLHQVLDQLWAAFLAQDATLVEINPLVETAAGWLSLDAKIELEDTARFRHPEWEQYPARSVLGRPLTEREQAAHQVNELDHRGTAGESFFEFPGGEVGVLASGGGASALVMDALLSTGLQPANYTEYSGNPSREKVKALTQVVLSIPNLKALWVVGGNANFTDIYETLDGLIDAFLNSQYAQKPGFVVLIRRGGPRWQEAFAMVQQRTQGLPIRLKLLGPDFPLVKTASALKELIDAA